MNKHSLESKFVGALMLSAIGDALGWMTEFQKSTTTLQKQFGVGEIRQFYSWTKKTGGRFYAWEDHISAGSYSDDTQMMLAVARSIRTNGYVDNEYFANKELSQWLAYARGAGKTVKTAAEKIQRKSAHWYNNFYTITGDQQKIDYRDCGANGVAMRILPIVLANYGNEARIKEEIFCNGIITHGHPRALIGAMLYGFALNRMLNADQMTFEWKLFLSEIGQSIPHFFDLNTLNENTHLQSWVIEWNKTGRDFHAEFEACLNEVLCGLRSIYKALRDQADVDHVLEALGCLSSETKSSGTATTLAGIYLACRYHNEPLEGIIKAVNALGTDTDSIAAFVGGLLGALHSDDVIPSELLAIQDAEYLKSVAITLLNKGNCGCNQEGGNMIESMNDSAFISSSPIKLVGLGNGWIDSVDYRVSASKNKKALVANVQIESGQSIVINRLVDIDVGIEAEASSNYELF